MRSPSSLQQYASFRTRFLATHPDVTDPSNLVDDYVADSTLDLVDLGPSGQDLTPIYPLITRFSTLPMFSIV
jgi:hypothetical protein